MSAVYIVISELVRIAKEVNRVLTRAPFELTAM